MWCVRDAMLKSKSWQSKAVRLASLYSTQRLEQTTAAGSSSSMPTPSSSFPDFKVAVFSAQQYVLDFLKPAIEDVFPKTRFFEHRLDYYSAALAKDHQAVIVFVNDTCNKKVLSKLKEVGVKFIALRCAGFDKVDLAAAEEMGIQVANVPLYSPQSVAEHAVGLALCLNRNLHLAYNRVAQGNYTLSGLAGFQMYRKTVGIIGTGAIGTQLCKIMKGFGCRVLAYDLRENPKCIEYGVEYTTLDDLYANSDIISLHCSLNETTSRMINKESLKKMKPNTILINVARGGLVNHDHLLAALLSHQIGAAGLDVYEQEDDMFFKDFTQFSAADRIKYWNQQLVQLRSLPNVVITPHSAFLTNEALATIAKTTVYNLVEFATNRPLTHQLLPKKE
eukprot:TRINITY_DN27441_c0_g1_i3.p1 TRINITY_DN27441_c0_g1~~TRINITY_DN27441_c0_g1_i3.p1  ORF type:complete len:391 (-),score=52.06 TRINITY_DN27441_c0_g1_i3:329-1501(-)